MAFQRRKSMDDTPAKGGRGDRLPSIRDQVGMVEWPKKAKFLTVRLHPGVVPVGVHKYPLFRKDGSPVISEKSKKQTELDKICLAFDPETMDRDPDKHCPYCEGELYFKIDYYAEGVVREEVENEPAKHKPTKEESKSGFKDFENDNSWTPNRVFKLTPNSYKKLKSLKQLNKVMVDGEKTPMSVDHEEYGCDVNMNFDPDATGDGMYGMQRSDQCALTDEEQAYLHWDIEAAVEKATESEEEAQRNVDWYKKHAGAAADGEDEDFEEGETVTIVDEDDEEFTGKIIEIDDKKVTIEDADGDEHTFRYSKIESMKKVKAGGKTKGKGKPADDDDDEDETPRRGAKSKRPADDDEDEAPRKSAAKGKAKPEPEEEEEESFEPEEGSRVTITDEDDDQHTGVVTEIDKRSVTIEDDDGEELTFKLAKVTIVEAKPAKKAAKGKAKPEPEEEEEDDEYTPEEGDNVIILDADEDELVKGKVTSIDAKNIEVTDEDDEEHTFKLAKVTVKPAPKKAAKGKAKPADDDDDEDEAPKGKAKGKSRPADDDDDDEDEAPRKPAAKGKGRSFDFDD